MSPSKNILIPCASLILTDYLPAGEGLICYNLIKFLAKSGNNYYVYSPSIKIKNQIPEVKFFQPEELNFFPAPDEYTYLKNWKKYVEAVQKHNNSEFINYDFDVVHYMLPFNLNQSYSPILHKPLVIGPIFYPWLELESEEYSDSEIRDKKDFFPIRKIKNFMRRRMIEENKIKQKETLEFADKIIVTLNCVKKYIPEKYHKKIIKIPIGADTYYFTPAEMLPDNNTILFLAYLVKRKGLKYLIEAINIIKNRVPCIKLLVVGEGPDKHYFEELTKHYGLEKYIQFCGHVNHSDTPDYFRKAQIYVLPSLGEPFGMSLVEAMSCGLPIVATDAGGAPEVIGDYNKKYLVPPRDSGALAEAIIKLLLNYEECKSTGLANREFAVRNYDWRIITSKYNTLYEKLEKS